MHVKMTQWNKMGDHELVKENTCREFEYTEAALEGCGVIHTFTIVHPTDYILEINSVYTGVISEATAKEILKNNKKD
jgi:hypothetical protein